MADRLTRVMDPEYIPIWLIRPTQALDNDKPIELLARGHYRRVAHLIAELEYPRRHLTRGARARSHRHRRRMDPPRPAPLRPAGTRPRTHRWRWQRGEPVRGLYLADEPDTAIAGWCRYLVERGLPPSAAIPHDRHLWHIDTTLADLSTEERLAAVGLHTHTAHPPRLAAIPGHRPGTLARRLARRTRTQRRTTHRPDQPLPPVRAAQPRLAVSLWRVV
jgi:hypothetical protein